MRRFESTGGRFIRGPGRLDGAKRVVVGDEAIEVSRAIVVATGTRPRVPPIDGLDGDATGFLADLAARLRDPKVCFAHRWQAGDVVIADNHALLHARRAFRPEAPRRISRVNVL